MRVLVAGAGATGGYFGGRLAEAGRDVTFLVREGRAAQLAERGLRIQSPAGSTRLTPTTIIKPNSPYDVVLVAVKSHALDSVIASLAPAVGSRTVIIPLLNGMRHLDALTSAFGASHVWGGLCMIHGTLSPDGDVVQMTGMARLVYGPLAPASAASPGVSASASVSAASVSAGASASAPVPTSASAFGSASASASGDDRFDAVAEALTGAGFDSRPSRHILAEMWEKWVFLSTIAAATTLMRGSLGAINAAPGGPAFLHALAAEVTAIATAAGHPPRPQAVDLLTTTLATTEPTTSSMYRDLTAGLPVESATIVGDLVTAATNHAVPAPLLSAAFTALEVYTASRPT